LAKGGEPASLIPAIGFLLPKLRVRGAVLGIDEAYALGVFVDAAEGLRRWVRAGEGSAPTGQGDADLAAIVQAWPDCSAASAAVFRVLDRSGHLRDLKEFAQIRRRIQDLQRELAAVTARYTGGEDYQKMLQSRTPALRDGRKVLAVKANYRGRIRGIVHEVSATGQTIFVEPEDVVEKNNDILMEQRRLDAEIRRVLLAMTESIAGLLPQIEALHEGVIAFECLRARARYSLRTGGIFVPETGTKGGEASLALYGARHPLLGPGCVPVDLVLSGPARAVIITGPNTGGKTVALKTVGLFALMNQAGLALPVSEGSVLPYFECVYADIGDEQSISQSLSTFSAHITAISAIERAATSRSLVLLDELGAGTDPQEGGALAMAVLDSLVPRGLYLFATTHHGILKNYGYTRPGVQNASVEFDRETLSPTFRIIMGVPGESRALEIAARSGLDCAILEAARTYLAGGQGDISALIGSLQDKHLELDRRLSAGRAEAARLAEERRQADLRALQLRQKEHEIREGQAGDLKGFLSDARKTLENLVRELREGEITREKTLAVKEFLAGLEAEAQVQDEALDAEAAALREESMFDAREAAGEKELAPGMEVFAGKRKTRGVLVRKDRKDSWIVETGSVRLSFPEGEIIPAKPSKKAVSVIHPEIETDAKMELSLLGLRLEEALGQLRRQIDAAVLSGLTSFAVIHGKGDGILQKGVHDYLSTEPLVEDFYFSRPELGGFGRTEVILRR
jgi:DNA mismatch repair protein MutS2